MSDSAKIVDVTRVMADSAALKRVSARNARRWGVLPLSVDEDVIRVVMVDEENDNAISQLESSTRLAVQVLPARDSKAVAAAIERYYNTDETENTGTPLGLLEDVVNRALQIRCSDIHVDPGSRRGLVRMRVDGVMRVERELSLEEAAEVVMAIKVASRLDIAERRMPQDGQMSLTSLGEEISMRVATIPTIRGEKVTLRILATESVAADLASLDTLGMRDRHDAMMYAVLKNPNGVILLSGPTGSGKTTTLYAALRHLNRPGTSHIISVENPVEIPMDGINQVHIDADRVSFAGSLRSILRHDPDVIMIGEIRDEETADIAVKSALTGHLVLSTLHANDSVGVITRLLNLGVTADLIVSSLRLVIAQRLVRRPCPHCCEWREPSEELREEFGWAPDDDMQVPVAKGCPLCGWTGHAGRLGLFEMIPFDASIRRLIREGASEEHLARHLYDERGLPTLARDGADKVRKGWTTVEEVRRVVLFGESA